MDLEITRRHILSFLGASSAVTLAGCISAPIKNNNKPTQTPNRQPTTKADPHTELTFDTADVATNGREGFWVIRNGANDWYAFYGKNTSTPRDLVRVTSTDGVNWGPETVVIDGSNQYSAEDIGLVYDDTQGRWVMFAEDDDNSVQRIWSASSIDSTSWTMEDTIPAFAEYTMNSNFIPLYDGEWYAFIEERDTTQSGGQYFRVATNTGTLTNGGDWFDLGRATLDGSVRENYAPFTVYQFNGENRVIVKDISNNDWYAYRPKASDYTAFEQVEQINAPKVADRELDAVAHDSDGWSEYYPAGEDTPWLYSWYSSNKGGDDNFDLLKG